MVIMDVIFFKDKKYSLKTLGLLTGQMDLDIENIHNNILIIAEVVDEPDKLPYFLENIKSLEIEDLEKENKVIIKGNQRKIILLKF